MKTFYILLIAVSSCTIGLAQEAETTQENPINIQFESLIEDSNNYQEFKVVNKSKLQKLKANTAGFISTLNNEVSELKSNIENQNQEISSLNENLTTTQANLATVTEEKESMLFLGMQLQKTTYNVLLWSIIAILIAGLIFFGLQFKSSNAQTQLAKNNLNAAEDELQEVRQKSLEKEQKLGRMLQDERNKLTRIKQT